MKYLFFDIECANCFDGIGKICEFGYVLCDGKFNVIEKNNIFINPQAPFHLSSRRKEKIKLSKSHKFYNSCPSFPYFYDDIKKILEKKDQMVFAYASNNDLSFIVTTLCRYNLENINFDCYDAQKIAAKFFKGDIKFPGLEKTHDLLCPEESEIIAHEASNDAYMTAKVVQEILKREKSTLKKYILDIQGIKDSSQDELKRYLKREKFNSLTKSIFIKNKIDLLSKEAKRKRYFISYDVKKDDELHMQVLEKLNKKGYFLVNNLSYTDKVIYLTKESHNYYKALFKWPHRKYKFINVSKFLG